MANTDVFNPDDLVPAVPSDLTPSIDPNDLAPASKGFSDYLQQAADYTKNAISTPTNALADYLTKNHPSIAGAIQNINQAAGDFSNQPLMQGGPMEMGAKLFGRATNPSVAPQVVGYGLGAMSGADLPLAVEAGLTALGGSGGRFINNMMGGNQFDPKKELGRIGTDTAVQSGIGLIGKGLSSLREPILNETDALKREALGLTPGDYSKDAAAGKMSVAGDSTVTPDVKASADTVIQEIPEVATAPATKQLGAAKAKIYELNQGNPVIDGQKIDGGLTGILADADKMMPVKQGITFTRAQAVTKDPSLTQAQRDAAQAVIDQLSPQVGSFSSAQGVKTALHEQLVAAYGKPLDALQTAQNQVKMAMAKDLRIGIENGVAEAMPDAAGIVQKINKLQGALYDTMPMMARKVGAANAPKIGPAIKAAAGRIGAAVPAPLAGGAIGGGLGYAATGNMQGAETGAMAGAGLTGMASFLGKSPAALSAIPDIGNTMQSMAPVIAPAARIAGPGGSVPPAPAAASAAFANGAGGGSGSGGGGGYGGPTLPPNAVSPDPFPTGLPRDTDSWSPAALGQLAKFISTKPPEIQGLGIGLMKALSVSIHARDKQKMQRNVADLARTFPEAFEPGMGVDNKLFHPDEQTNYMDTLQHGLRKGVVSSSFLAQQRDAFLNKNDSSILPIEENVRAQLPGLQTNSTKAGMGKPRKYNY